MNELYAVIMAGGRGERFWPLGRCGRPKQFLPLLSESSMLETTVMRLSPLFKAENILVVTSEKHVEATRKLLPLPPDNILGEPEGRDTAPCIAYACGEILRRGGEDAVMAVMPADHAITPAAAFRKQLCDCAEFAASHDALLTIGIVPRHPATGYGYINAGRELEAGFREVVRFVEKPERPAAEKFIAGGNFWWNSGIFVWRTGAILEALREFTPELYAFATGYRDAADPGAFLAEKFPTLNKISIDRGVMEKASNAAVSPAGFEWDDIGSWSALRDKLPADADGNAGSGRRVVLDCRGSLVISTEDHLVGAIGLENMAVIHTHDATLICPLALDQQVKTLLGRIGGDPENESFI